MGGSREALIIATGTYEDQSLRRLRAPAQDAAGLARVLGDAAIGNFQVEQVIDQPAHRVNRAIERFFANRSLEDLLLVHLSCHGVKNDDGWLYFAATDTEKNLLGSTAVPAAFLNDQMERCRARSIVLLLDCCYSGAFRPGSKGDAGMHLKEKLSGRGRVILTASNAIEYAWEGEDVSGEGQPSLFTGAIVQGLQTGEADRDRDGVVSINDLFTHVREEVLAARRGQTPLMWALEVEGNLYVARNPRPPTDEPVALPPELHQVLNHPLPSVRIVAIEELAQLARSNSSYTPAARKALEDLRGDDSSKVSLAAHLVLESLQPQSQPGGESPAGVSPRPARKAPSPSPPAREPPASVSPTDILEEPTKLRVLEHPNDVNVNGVAFSPDGELLATASSDRYARVWDIASGRKHSWAAHDNLVWGVAFSPDGDLLATASSDRSARVWHAVTGKKRAQVVHDDIVWGVAFSPDGQLLATASEDKSARIWEVASGRERTRVTHDSSVRGVAFSPNGRLLATAGSDRTARVWEVATGKKRAQVVHDHGVWGVAFSPDGQFLATASIDGTARVWHAVTGKKRAQVVHDDGVWGVAFSPDGQLLATASEDKSARIWEVASGRERARVVVQGDAVRGVAFSPDGRLLATANKWNGAWIWRLTG